MYKLIILCFILVLAGLTHFLDPFSFVNAIPLFIPFKLEIIYITGFIEFIFVFGLLFKKTRALSAKMTSLYFLCLVPIHVYVSWNHISMFGISDPFLLWARTLFQFFFIWWSYSVRKV